MRTECHVIVCVRVCVGVCACGSGRVGLGSHRIEASVHTVCSNGTGK